MVDKTFNHSSRFAGTLGWAGTGQAVTPCCAVHLGEKGKGRKKGRKLEYRDTLLIFGTSSSNGTLRNQTLASPEHCTLRQKSDSICVFSGGDSMSVEAKH